MKTPYDDIINLPHHVSATRPQMSIANRAAQFAPFAALTGYDAAIEETARFVDEKIELDENAITALDMKLRVLADKITDHPKVSVTYFLPDEYKTGGAYITVTTAIKKIDEFERTLVLMNNQSIAIEDILDIEGELFKDLQ